MLTNLPQYIANAKKAIIQVTGLVGALCALGILPDPYSVYAATLLGVLTTVTHYITANGPAPGTEPAIEDFDPPDEEAEVPAEWMPSETVTASQVAAENEQAAPPSE
jgi:hypothetical protein